MKPTLTIVFAIFLIAGNGVSSASTGLNSLENFVKTVRSGKAEFTQTVTSPTRSGEAPRVKDSRGIFEFQRPGKFKFQYRKPFEQLIVADGTNLWVYDADLNQASQRNQSTVFANTPVALIASAVDLVALRSEFALENAPDQDGLLWVSAKPKAADSTLRGIRIGFKGEVLRQLDITDNFGQRSVIQFTAMQVNPTIPRQTFQFTPPAGAEVLKQ